MPFKNLIGKIFMGVLAFAILTGCGSDGGSGAGGEESFLTLTIGDETLQSNEETSISLKDKTKFITTVKISEGGEITLGGEDSDLFEINGINLSFKSTVDAWDPMDHDYNGEYKLVILASKGDETIRYTVTYQVDIPVSAQELLVGKSFWIERPGTNEFYYQTFHETTFDNQYYTNYDQEQTDISLYGIDANYYRDTFSYTVNNKYLVCTLKEESPLTFNCTNGSQTQTVVYLKNKPAFETPESWKVSATSDDIHNIYNDDMVPKIKSLTVYGNTIATDEGSRAKIVLNGQRNTAFVVEGKIENEFYLKSLQIQLDGGSKAIGRSSYTGVPDTTQTFDCQFNRMDNTSINYTCDSITIDDNESENITTIQMYACDKNNPEDPDAKCNMAEVPVGFYYQE